MEKQKPDFGSALATVLAIVIFIPIVGLFLKWVVWLLG